MENDRKRGKSGNGAASGAVAIIFLIIGFQGAVFVQKVLRRPPVEIVSDTVARPPEEPAGRGDTAVLQIALPQERRIVSVRKERPYQRGAPKPSGKRREVETFRFDPNTVSVEDLVRLGLSEKQAQSIGNYRSKGGKFRSADDFGKMYVVSDSLFERVRDSIDIPRLELNSADSASLTSLRGIGPWYAGRILEYRNSLGGFHDVWQLLEVRGIDSARILGFIGSVRVDTSLLMKIDLYAAEEESLARHPYVGRSAARAICRYRHLEGVDTLSAGVLVRENIIGPEEMGKLCHYLK